MLSILRKNAGSWAIKLILAFIALTFVWWGVGTYSEREREVAATVGKTRITMAELADAAAGLEKSYRDVYGSAFTPEMAKSLDLRRQALDGLVRRALFLAEAERMGIRASDEEVRREIAATPAFQVDGRFLEDRYRSVLSYNRVTPADYEASRRTEITLRKVEGLLAASARVSEAEAREFFDLSYRRMRLLVVTSDPARVQGVSPPGEAEIAAKYEETKERYRIPARVKLAVARFEPRAFARGADPSEQEIVSFYEGNEHRFRTEEERLLSHLLVPYTAETREAARKKAEELLREAAKGREAFEALARKHSGGKPGGAWFTRRDLRPELADAAFSAAVDSVVGPVDVRGGFMLARIHRIRFPETLPLAEVRDRVISLLKEEKGKDLAVLRAYEAHGKAMESQDLAAACAPYGISPVDTGWLAAGTEGSLPSPVVAEALPLSVGEIGPVKTVGDTHYLFRVTAREEARISPLETVRGEVRDAVMAEKREAAARGALEAVLAACKTAGELEKKAREAGMRAEATPYFLPLSEPLPGALAAAGEIRADLLALSAGNPVSPKIHRAGPRFLSVAFLDEQLPGDKEWRAGKDAFIRDLAEQKKNARLQAFVDERMKQAKVEIHPQALN